MYCVHNYLFTKQKWYLCQCESDFFSNQTLSQWQSASCFIAREGGQQQHLSQRPAAAVNAAIHRCDFFSCCRPTLCTTTLTTHSTNVVVAKRDDIVNEYEDSTTTLKKVVRGCSTKYILVHPDQFVGQHTY